MVINSLIKFQQTNISEVSFLIFSYTLLDFSILFLNTQRRYSAKYEKRILDNCVTKGSETQSSSYKSSFQIRRSNTNTKDVSKIV